MNINPRFLSYDDIILIHDEEIILSGGATGLRNPNGIKSAIGAVKATFNDKYLMDIFEMAATYLYSLVMNHPFVDGNKRVALASSITFLLINGFEIDENHPEEFADLVLDVVRHKLSKDDLIEFMRSRSYKPG